MSNSTELSRRDEVLLFICKYALEHGGNSPSTYTIAQHFQVGQQTIYSHLSALVKEGKLLQKDKKWVVEGATWRPPKVLREMLREYGSKWRKGNFLAVRRGMAAQHIQELYRLQKGLCWWCAKPLDGVYEIDHRVPLSKGGQDTPENTCLACGQCNQDKANKMPSEFNGRLL